MEFVFGGDNNVLKLDCGDNYIALNPVNAGKYKSVRVLPLENWAM